MCCGPSDSRVQSLQLGMVTFEYGSGKWKTVPQSISVADDPLLRTVANYVCTPACLLLQNDTLQLPAHAAIKQPNMTPYERSLSAWGVSCAARTCYDCVSDEQTATEASHYPQVRTGIPASAHPMPHTYLYLLSWTAGTPGRRKTRLTLSPIKPG